MSGSSAPRGGALSSRGSLPTSHATEFNAPSEGQSHITAPATLLGGVWETATHATHPLPISNTSTEPSAGAGASQQSQLGSPHAAFSQQFSGSYDEPEPEPDSPGEFNFNSTTRVPARSTGARGPTTPIPVPIPNPASLKIPVGPLSAFPLPSPAPSAGGGGATPRLSTRVYPYSSGAPSASPRARPPTPPPLPTLSPLLATTPVQPLEPPSSPPTPPRAHQDTETISLLTQLNRCVLKNGSLMILRMYKFDHSFVLANLDVSVCRNFQNLTGSVNNLKRNIGNISKVSVSRFNI